MYRHVISDGKFKLDWWHAPIEYKAAYKDKQGRDIPERKADPEFRLYSLYFLTEEDAKAAATELKLEGYRIYPSEQL